MAWCGLVRLHDTLLFDGNYEAATFHGSDQKYQETCQQENVSDTEAVECSLVRQPQPLTFAADIPNRRCRLEVTGNSDGRHYPAVQQCDQGITGDSQQNKKSAFHSGANDVTHNPCQSRDPKQITKSYICCCFPKSPDT